MQKLSMPCAFSLMTLIKPKACIPQQLLNAERMWKLKFRSRQRAQPSRSHSLTFPPALIISCPLLTFCTSHPRGTLNSCWVIVISHIFLFLLFHLEKYTLLKLAAVFFLVCLTECCVFIGRSLWQISLWLNSSKQPYKTRKKALCLFLL